MGWWSCKRIRGRNAADVGQEAERKAAKLRILADAQRQRRERDRAVPPEHRAREAERRESPAQWYQPTRWYEPTPLTLGQRHGYRVLPVLAGRGRWPW